MTNHRRWVFLEDGTPLPIDEGRHLFATKAALVDLRSKFREFRTDLRREAVERETRLVTCVFGAMLAQTASSSLS